MGLKKRDAAPNELTSITIDADGSIIIGKRDIEDDINVNLGAGVGVTKRDASPEDLVSISVGADGSVHIRK